MRAIAGDFAKTECPSGADGQIERVSQRLGLIAAPGEFAIALEVAPWPAGAARKAAAWAFQAWLDNRGGSEPGEARQAISQVRLFLEQHGDSRFDPLDNPDAKPSPNRAGWRKGEGEVRGWLIPSEAWRAEVCNGLDPKFVARTLADRGFIFRANDGFQPVRKISGANQRVFVVTARILSGGDDAA